MSKRVVSGREPSSYFTIHTSRTIMYAELAAVMAHADLSDYNTALSENITGKATKYNETYTASLLRKLYSFDQIAPAFQCFQYFWQLTREAGRPLIALLYAISRDALLLESIPMLQQVPVGIKAPVELFMQRLNALHPEQYAASTLRATAQRIVSSWKQAGYLDGKVRNIRRNPTITVPVAAFGLLLGYLDGARGDSLFTTPYVTALMLPYHEIRDLAHRAMIAGLLHYQQAGAVTIIHFNHLFQTLGIHGDNE